MARLAGQALPDITGNSRGNMSRDPHFDQILGVLAALGAGPEHVSAVAQAYMQRPGPEPAERAANTAPTCATPTRHVSLRKNMPKHKMPKSLGQKGSLYKQGKNPNEMWYFRYRGPALTKDGTICLKTKHERLGEVSTISEAKAREELGRRISRTRTQPAPTASITVKEYYERNFWPDKERRLKRSGLD